MQQFFPWHTSRLAWFWLSAAALWTGCTEPNTYVEPPPPDVTVARPVQQDVTDYLEATGTTSAFERVEIRARVKGFLEEIKFEFGQDVEEGQLLYVIDPKPYQATLNRALAAKAVAVAEFENAKAKYERAVPLAETGAVSREELVERLAAQEVARAAIKATEAQIDQARLDVGYTQIKSPINGRVGKTFVDVGNLVGDSEATHLTTVVRYDPVYADFNISELALLDVRSDPNEPNRPRREKEDVVILMQLANETDYRHVGQLDYADLGVDASTGTFMLRGVFPNPNLNVVPGLFVKLRIPIKKIEGALLVPEAAVGMDQQGRFALVVTDEEEVQRRTVAVGSKVGDMLVILEGLQADSRVVIRGLQSARPGAKVNPLETTLEPPAVAESISRESTMPATLDDDADADSTSAPEAPKPSAANPNTGAAAAGRPDARVPAAAAAVPGSGPDSSAAPATTPPAPQS